MTQTDVGEDRCRLVFEGVAKEKSSMECSRHTCVAIENAMIAQSSSQLLQARPIVTAFFERRTSSIQYVVADPQTGKCAIIDPVLDFDPKSGATATHSADALIEHIVREGCTLEWILDTHPHADHLSAAGYLKEKTDVPTAI